MLEHDLPIKACCFSFPKQFNHPFQILRAQLVKPNVHECEEDKLISQFAQEKWTQYIQDGLEISPATDNQPSLLVRLRIKRGY